MAQLVVAAAGAAVGFMVGGPMGAKIGWVAGTMIGSAFAPTQKSQGPRLDDLKVSTSSYGTQIPYVAGHPRVAGQIVWASTKREISTTQEAGKGGGGSEYTSYTYEVDLLILLSDNEIAAVTRVWSNGELVYDGTTVKDSLWSRMTVYTGASDQLPDPDYEAVVGTANAPAYRGRGSVFIKSLQLGGSGQIPNLTFEVATSASVDYSRQFANADVGVTIAKPVIMSVDDTIRIATNTPGDNTVKVFDFDGNLLATESRTATDLYPGDKGLSSYYSYPVGMVGGSPIRAQFLDQAIGGTYKILTTGIFDHQVMPAIGSGLESVLPVGEFVGGVSISTDSHAIIYTSPTPATSGGPVINKWYLLDCSEGTSGILVDQGTVSPELSIYKLGFGRVPTFHFAASALSNSHKEITAVYGAGDLTFSVYKIDESNNLAIAEFFIHEGGILGGGFSFPSIFLNNGMAVVIANKALTLWGSTTDILTESLEGVVNHLCLNSGLITSQFDASLLSSITRPVHAMAISQVSSARTVLEMLAAAYYFDCVLSDKLYFRPRASASVATLTFDEFGVAVDGNNSADPLPLMMANELEIPAQMAITYSNIDGDYQTDTQYSDRLLTGQESTSATTLPLGFTASEGKQIADAMLLDKAVSALSTVVSVGITRAELEPTDVVILTGDDGFSYRMRITKKTEAAGVITLGCVADDAAVFTQAGVTDGGTASQTEVLTTPTTTLELLDIPLLRDADNLPGHYVAVKGSAANWSNCALFESADDVTYTQTTTISGAAVMGDCTTTLGAWAGGNFADEASTLTVDVGAGQLSSVTHEQMLSNHATNAALVGDEIIQFRDATLVSAGVYTLRGLLRGKRGTEWATGTHAASERFVLLGTSGLRFIPQQTSDIGLLAYYKAINAGQTLSAVTAQSMTLAANVLKPFRPVNVRYSPRTDGGVDITWDRRTRLSENWLAGTLPLGETTEAYEIDIYISGVFKRKLFSTTPTVSYSYSNFYADAGYVVAALSVVSAQIFQVSSVVGLGGGVSASSPSGSIEGDTSGITSTTIWKRPGIGATFGSNVLVYQVLRRIEGDKFDNLAVYKVFESTDGGINFTQRTTLTAPLSQIPSHWAHRASDGVYITMPIEKRLATENPVIAITKGTFGSEPAITTSSWTRPYLPFVMGCDGTTFLIITEANKSFTSTDGVNWTDNGFISGLPFSLVTASTGSGLSANVFYPGLVYMAGKWFFYGPTLGLFSTAVANGSSGWTRVGDLPMLANQANGLAQYYGLYLNYKNKIVTHSGSLFAVGGRTMLQTVGYDFRPCVFVSVDAGVNWTVSLELAVGAPIFGSITVVGTTLYAYPTAYGNWYYYSIDAGANWTLGSTNLTNISSEGAYPTTARLMVLDLDVTATSPELPPSIFKSSADGATFTSSTGIT